MAEENLPEQPVGKDQAGIVLDGLLDIKNEITLKLKRDDADVFDIMILIHIVVYSLSFIKRVETQAVIFKEAVKATQILVQRFNCLVTKQEVIPYPGRAKTHTRRETDYLSVLLYDLRGFIV